MTEGQVLRIGYKRRGVGMGFGDVRATARGRGGRRRVSVCPLGVPCCGAAAVRAPLHFAANTPQFNTGICKNTKYVHHDSLDM